MTITKSQQSALSRQLDALIAARDEWAAMSAGLYSPLSLRDAQDAVSRHIGRFPESFPGDARVRESDGTFNVVDADDRVLISFARERAAAVVAAELNEVAR